MSRLIFKLKSLRSYSTQPDGPLHGIKVLDLTRVLAGPYCTMLLGDLGAEILKIEHPTKGDDTRHWGPPYAQPLPPHTTPESAYFLSVNRNKKSITVDLKQPQGKQIIEELVTKCDVLVENFGTDKLNSMGLGYERLNSINPKLIWAGITGYGTTGPLKNKPGYDVMVEAEAGLMHITGSEYGEPVKVGVAITDITTGLYTLSSILASLYSRNQTGLGQKIDSSLLECQLACLANLASSHLIGNSNPSRTGTAHPSIVPYQAFVTKSNKPIILGAGNDTQFITLCTKVLELPYLVNDDRFKNNEKRVENRKELVRIIEDRVKQEGVEYWLKRLEGKGLPYSKVNDLKETFKMEQVNVRDMVQSINHSTVGEIKLVGPAIKSSGPGFLIRSPPPTLGQHTNQILKDLLGYTDDKIKQLRKDDVI